MNFLTKIVHRPWTEVIIVLAIVAVYLFGIAPAFAQGVVTVDSGSIFDTLAPVLTVVLYVALLGLVGVVIAFIPAGWRAVIGPIVLKYAQEWGLQVINLAVQRVREATHGKTISVNVGSEVLAKAAQEALNAFPGWLVSFLGGPEGVKKFLVGLFEKANVNIPDEATADDLLNAPKVQSVKNPQ